MNRQDAEKWIEAYLKPVYGFALKRCRNLQDAEDLSQEIALKAFRTLLQREDIIDPGKFIWTIAHNALSNYYRDNSRSVTGISIDEGDKADIFSDLEMRESTERLQSEIARLSKLQRRIVIAYYYENKKQSAIAKELGIPVGTVKWHLFEAKKDLKRGMEMIRTPGELKYNPIRFRSCGTFGRLGGDYASNFFRSALSQNIIYAVWKETKTVNQIADMLGVSPVYVESEAEHLEEYDFFRKEGDKYLCNILLEERTTELNRLQDEMYDKAAKLIANDLYEELMRSDIWDDPNICGGCTGEMSFTSDLPKDKNFFLWSLIPYLSVHGGEHLKDTSVSFEEIATLRPDGGHNICEAIIDAPDAKPLKYAESMRQWSGPNWNGRKDNDRELLLWQIDMEWSAKRIDESYLPHMERELPLLRHALDGDTLSREEYAYLAERGLIKMIGDPEEAFKLAFQCVLVLGAEAKKKLLAIGDRVKERHHDALKVLQRPYADALLADTPKHLHQMQRFALQNTFYTNTYFLIHCLQELLQNGKLQLPTEEQKRALTTLILYEN